MFGLSPLAHSAGLTAFVDMHTDKPATDVAKTGLLTVWLAQKRNLGL